MEVRRRRSKPRGVKEICKRSDEENSNLGRISSRDDGGNPRRRVQRFQIPVLPRSASRSKEEKMSHDSTPWKLHGSDLFSSSHRTYYSQMQNSGPPSIGFRPLNSPNIASSMGAYEQFIQQYQHPQNQSQFRHSSCVLFISHTEIRV